METIIYKIDFFSYWHVSSGLYGSTHADLLVNKTKEGLPFIPGKTLKGLLREAAEFLNKLNSDFVKIDFVNDVFGEKEPEGNNNDSEKYREEALSFFSSATLSKNLQSKIDSTNSSYLYKVLSSTKISEIGLAEDHSLRELEVTIPLTLYASIEDFPKKEGYVAQLEHCMNFVKRMGLNRSRGLGRCQFSIIKED